MAAEAMGTAFLLMAVVGSGVMAERLTPDVGLQLLANMTATGAILVVLIIGLGPISGAHFNPAVTLAMGLRKRITWRLGLAYAGAQIAGGLFGVALAHIMFDLAPWQISQTVRTGGGQWLAEAVATFGLVWVIFLTLKARADAVAWTVGLYIASAYWFTASTSFANPAVTIARAFTDTFSGIAPASAPIFVLAQLVGAGLAALAAAWFAPDEG